MNNIIVITEDEQKIIYRYIKKIIMINVYLRCEMVLKTCEHFHLYNKMNKGLMGNYRITLTMLFKTFSTYIHFIDQQINQAFNRLQDP